MKAQRNLAEVFNGLFSPQSEDTVSRYALDEAIDFWLKTKRGTIDLTSYQRYEEYINNFREFLKDRYPALRFVDEITPECVKDFMNYGIEVKKLSTKTVNSARQALSNLFETLIQYEKFARNPAARVNLLKMVKKQKRRCLSNDELRLIFAQARQENDGVFWESIFVTFYITGMRRDELRTL
jgi:integrase